MSPRKERECICSVRFGVHSRHFQATDRIAMLVLNREFGETSSALQAPRKRRVRSFKHGCVPEREWSDIYVTWNRTGWFVLLFAVVGSP